MLQQIQPFRQYYIIPLLLLAFFLRLYHLDGQALRGDEAATVHYAALPISQLWELSRITDPHPPLYYLLLHPWQSLFGEDAWTMRFAGVVASLLAVAGLYTLSRLTLRRPGAGLLAAGLLAINPFQIWLAQDVRSYPFFTLLGLLSSWALWQALRSHHSSLITHQLSATGDAPANRQYAIRNTQYVLRFTFYVLRFTPWLAYTLFTVACFYIHYYTVFLIAFQGLFVLLHARLFWQKKWPWLVSQIAIGLLMIPGLQLAYNFMGQAAGGIDEVSTAEILRRAGAALLTGFTLDASSSLWVSLLLAPIWLTGLVTLLRRERIGGAFWVLFFALPVLGVIALSIDRPFFKERFLIQAQPAFELLLAVGFLTLVQRPPTHSTRLRRERSVERSGQAAGRQPQSQSPTLRLRSGQVSNLQLRFTFYVLRFVATLLFLILLLVNLITLRNYHTDPLYAKAPPWQLYHDYVSDQAQPGDVMLTNFPEAAVSYYSPNDLPFYVVPDERDLSVADRIEATQAIANAYERIWFLPLLRQGFDEQGDVLNWLDRHADRVDQTFFPAYNLNLYLTPPAIEAGMIRQPAAFAHGIRLRGYQILDEQGRSRLASSHGAGQSVPLLTIKADDDFTLSLYWQAGGPTAAAYTVFTHLVAADGFNRAGQDNQPVWGSYPTTQWQPGERLTDKYTLTLPEGAPPGDHRLQVGWYRADRGERIPVVDAAGQPLADHVILDVVVRVEDRKE